MTNKYVARLFGIAYEKAATMSNSVNGFRKTCNRHIFTENDFTIFNDEDQTKEEWVSGHGTLNENSEKTRHTTPTSENPSWLGPDTKEISKRKKEQNPVDASFIAYLESKTKYKQPAPAEPLKSQNELFVLSLLGDMDNLPPHKLRKFKCEIIQRLCDLFDGTE